MDRKKACFYEQLDQAQVRCQLCPHACVLAEGKQGICQGRRNVGGTLYAENYGQIVALALDPVEKKPLYHFYPGSSLLSVGVNGCNLRCDFCQNWQVSQELVTGQYLSPEALAEMAHDQRALGIAFTYTEPLIWYEYLRDCALVLSKAGLKVVVVSNGFLNAKPLEALLPWVDAFNIDFKSSDDAFYRTFCGGSLEPVLTAIEMINASPAHLEITNLVIPGCNDSLENTQHLIDWIARLNPAIPLHFSAYHPAYNCTLPATDPQALRNIVLQAKEQLSYVYAGNFPDQEDTCCPQCHTTLISRIDYRLVKQTLVSDQCPVCQYPVAVVL